MPTLREKAHSFLKTSLQRWAHSGYDSHHGGYVEALTFDGSPLSARDKRFRIHGRTIFSHAAGTLWGYYDGLETAEAAFSFVMNTCQREHGGFVSTTAADGTHVDTHARTYEHSFLLLGLGWLAYVSQKAEHMQALEAVWNFVDTKLRHKDGGFITSLPSDGTPRQQNPHMHMFEALLNLYELFKDTRWLIEAENIYTLFTKHFFKRKEGILREFFTDTWEYDKERGHLIDAGHHYEWTWLLYKYELLSGRHSPELPMLYAFAIEHGTDAQGLGYDENYDDGSIYRDTHRLWVQTEALKAHLVMSKRAGTIQEKEEYLKRANTVLQALFDYYLIEERGVWHDQINALLENISNDAPTSTLYHIVVALHEYLQIHSM